MPSCILFLWRANIRSQKMDITRLIRIESGQMFVEELKNTKEWEDFLKVTLGGTFYHSIKWRNVIERSFSHPAIYLVVRDTNGAVVGVCPGFVLKSGPLKTYVSMPHSDYGGPVIDKSHIQKASLSLRSFIKRFCSDRGIAYAKILFTGDQLGRFFNSPLGYVDTNTCTMKIDLKTTPSNFIWNKVFSGKRRRNIRHVERDGFQAQEARSRSDLRDFYNLYYINMKHIGSSPYPYEFMESMWSILYPKNLRIWLVEKEKRIGGIAVFKDGRRVYLVYAGIDRKQGSSQYSIVPYLVWKEIKTAEEEGYRYVSLGATPSDPKNRYYLQKMSFGSSFYQQEIVWYPFSSTGRILLQTRAKTVLAWKTLRKFLPIDFKRIIESKLSRF